MMSLVASYFVLSFFPREVLDEISDWIESVPENFPTYSCFLYACLKNGRIMLYPSASFRPSDCKVFRFRINPPNNLRPILS